MRILATADLHYNIARSRESTERLAERVVEEAARRGETARDDVLILVGDIAGAEKKHFDACLNLFADFPGHKLFVAGNHSLWSSGGQDAMEILREELPARGRRFGFHCLEFEPLVINRVGFVGTVGWYDFAFRRDELAIPMRFYRRKVAPGAARYFSEHRDLLEKVDDLSQDHHEIFTRWMDGVNVTLEGGDEEFTATLVDKLARHLDVVAPRADRIVVAIHHVPFENMMPHLAPEPKWQFVAAFMGSPAFGRACLAQPKVSHVICGHTHQPLRTRNEHIECLNVGSNYNHKRLVEIEISDEMSKGNL